MTKEDFVDWQRHPITVAVMAAVSNRIQDGLEELGATAGEYPIMDARKAGLIRGMRDITEMSWGELE